MAALLALLIANAPGIFALGTRLIDQGRTKATEEELADAGLADDRFIRAYLRLYGVVPKGGAVVAGPVLPVATDAPALVTRATGYIKPRAR